MVTPRQRKQKRLRALVLVAAVVSGLLVGIIVIAATGGDKRPTVYQPFRVLSAARLIDQIDRDGPVLFPDPTGGPNTVYLDLENGDVVARHFVPTGGTLDCVAQYDYDDDDRYEDCEGRPIDPSTLRRFPVTLEGDNDDVYVDLRDFVPE